ncbi:MAG TPA: isoprenylcysteine carboxylmethyltransferase family protein [Crinalium sp.]|jgi:protein-S-isoprenylcysteine O-methyltransferase Ste14
MKLFTDWGFSWEGWRHNQRGEYWVVAQAILILGLFFLPAYRPSGLMLTPPWIYITWGVAGLVAGLAIALFGKGLLDLGKSLTPLPYPRDDGALVQSGVYGIVRHPVYSGVILVVLSLAIAQLSLSHLLATAILFIFFNAKASREEEWLRQKYPDYDAYQQRVKKLIPWVY